MNDLVDQAIAATVADLKAQRDASRAEAEGLRRERDDLKALADKVMNERDAAEAKAKFERERANEWLAQKHDAEKRLAATAAVEIARDPRAALAAPAPQQEQACSRCKTLEVALREARGLTDAELAEMKTLAAGGPATALEWRAAALAAHPFLLLEVTAARAALAALVSSPRPEVLSPSALICRKGGDIKHIHVNDCFGPVTAPRPAPLSAEAQEARRPPSPESLVGAPAPRPEWEEGIEASKDLAPLDEALALLEGCAEWVDRPGLDSITRSWVEAAAEFLKRPRTAPTPGPECGMPAPRPEQEKQQGEEEK